MIASHGRPRVAYIRGSYVNPFEVQYLEPLTERYEIVIAYPRSHRYPLDSIQLPLRALHCLDFADGIVPRSLGSSQLPNPLKALGRDEFLLGLEAFLRDFDIVHVAEKTFYYAYQVARLKQRLNLKLITVQCEINPYWFAGRPGLMGRAQAVIDETDLFVARSQRARAALLTEGVSADRIDVIGHGIDPDRFKPGPRDVELCSRFGIDPGRFVVLLVGRMVWEKGLYALADAVASLVRDPEIQRVDPLFVIAGDGPERPGFESHLQLLGLTDRFRLLGSVPYPLLPAVHRMADVFVLPSISTRTVLEQFGIALIEAMGTGTPVIATHCGAIDEVVGDAGLLVQPNDHFRLAEALRELCLSPERRRQLGAAGHARLLENFTAQAISEKIGLGYDRVLGREAPAGSG